MDFLDCHAARLRWADERRNLLPPSARVPVSLAFAAYWYPVPQGEFVAFAVLTLAAFEQTGRRALCGFLLALAAAAVLSETLTLPTRACAHFARGRGKRALPCVVAAAVVWGVWASQAGFALQVFATVVSRDGDGACGVPFGASARGHGPPCSRWRTCGGSLCVDRTGAAVLRRGGRPHLGLHHHVVLGRRREHFGPESAGLCIYRVARGHHARLANAVRQSA